METWRGGSTPRPQITASAVLARFCSARPGDLNVVLLAAHPDDETVFAGARLPHFPRIRLVVATDGAPRAMRDALRAGYSTRESYARVRAGELRGALRAGGIVARVMPLGIADGEAAFHLAELAIWLAHSLRREPADVLVTHPYEGGHPDHDAAAFAAAAACVLLERRGAPAPVLLEMACYHACEDGMRTGVFLGCSGGCIRPALTSEAVAARAAMLACYRTQSETLHWCTPERERFRCAPAYDFSGPPHAGSLHYERHGLGITGDEWRALARAAEARLHAA